jgi:hypothetical protein
MMTVLDHSPRSSADWQPRLDRRHEIVTTGGMAGVLRVGDALATCGYQVHEFVADVQDGAPYGCVTCTVALTSAEMPLFVDRLRHVPAVISVDPR